jgi:hypothetical protein
MKPVVRGAIPDAYRLARVAALAATAMVAACASPASNPAATQSGEPTTSAAESVFTSPLYGYSATLTAAWRVIPAADAWDGEQEIGHDDPTVDQMISPQVAGRCEHLFLCGPIAWAISASTEESLAVVASDMDAMEAADHDCPETPESSEPTEIDGEPALLAATHCPANAPDGGQLILRAITIHDGTAYYFWMQDPAHEDALEPSVRSDFEALIAVVDLPRD